jgi:predicted phosphodiesterase
MRAIIASDTHKNRKGIESIVQFAKANGINTVFDCGDLHGEISAYSGMNLHAVYWEEACSAMDRWDFSRDIRAINGTVHENGSVFALDDLIIFMQHNFLDYDKGEHEVTAEKSAMVDEMMEGTEDRKRLILFGHTHSQHYNHDGKAVAINPGDVLNSGAFAVVDTDNGTVEYWREGTLLLKVDMNSDISQVRGLRENERIERFKSGGEIFVYKIDGKEHRTEVFNEIRSAFLHEGKQLRLYVKDKDSLEQLIIGDFRSRKYSGIGSYFDRFENGNYSGSISGYIARKEIEGKIKEILVVGKDEIEGPAFDRIDSKITPIIEDSLTLFVAKTVLKEKDRSKNIWDDETLSHIVLNDKTIATYKSVEEIKHIDGRIYFTAKDENNKNFVGEIGADGKVKEGKKYDFVSNASSDGKLIGSKILYVAREDNSMFLVVDGVEQKKHHIDKKAWHQDIRDPCFVDGKLAYKVCYENKELLVVDGQELIVAEKKSGYDQAIVGLREIDGKLAYMLVDKDGEAMIIYDRRIIHSGKDIMHFGLDGEKLVLKNKDWKWAYQDGAKFEGDSKELR